jgi:hypothetical protein
MSETLRSRLAPAIVVALGLAAVPCLAQDVPVVGYHLPVWSGWSAITNPTETALTSAPIVVTQAGSPWLKLWFGGVDLGQGSWIKVTGAQDEVVQLLDADALAAWSDSSAYFNGDTVVAELVVAPGDTASAHVTGLDAGFLTPVGSDTICGTTDDRVPSTEPRVGRLLNSSLNALCSGGLVSSNSCYLTAGHCVTTGAVYTVEFNCPPSNAGGSIVHPGPEHQYPLNSSTLAFQNGGVGNDWALARLNANTTTGLSAALLQGFYRLAPALPSVGAVTRITGFGSATGVLNLANKTHTGPCVTAGGGNGTTVQYQVDTTGGNSGSSVVNEATGRVFGIHTHGGCTSSGGQNSGTAITHPGPQAHYALTCAPPAPAYAIGVTQSGAGSPIVVSVTGAPPSSELFNLVSLTPATPVDTGLFFGLTVGPASGDVAGSFFLPLGAEPFHVLADAAGSYALAIPTPGPGTAHNFDVVSVAFAPGPDFTTYYGRSPAVNATVTF